MKLPTLYSRASNGKVKQWKIEVIKNKIITTYGYIDGSKLKTNPTVYKDENKAQHAAKVKWTNKMKKGHVKDRKLIDKPFVLPMLAHNFRKYSHKISFSPYIYVQPKLDGVRCLAHKDKGIILMSRNGNRFQHLKHIKDALLKTGWFKKGFYVDGELFTTKLDPEQIKGADRKSVV